MIDFNELRNKKKAWENMYFIVVAGDREFTEDYLLFLPSDSMIRPFTGMEIVTHALDTVLSNVKERGLTIKIITSDNRGTDATVIKYAMSHDYDVLRHDANWDEFGNRAGFERNERMFFQVGTKPHKAALLFWNGTNNFTRNLIYNAYLQSVPTKVYNYVLKRWLSQEEIRQVQLEEDRKQFQYRK